MNKVGRFLFFVIFLKAILKRKNSF